MTAPANGKLWLVRTGVVGAILVLAAVSLTGLGSGHSHGDLRMVDAAGAVAAASGGSSTERAMSVEAGTFRFELSDATAGEHSFTLVSAGSSDVVATLAPAPEELGDQRSVDLAPGSYTLFCTTPGHAEAGMVYEIEVR